MRDGKTMGVYGHDQVRGDKSQSLGSDWRNGEGRGRDERRWINKRWEEGSLVTAEMELPWL